VGRATGAAAAITSFTEFERVIGNSASGDLPVAVKGIFENGGTR
jgi:hypothetical protein